MKNEIILKTCGALSFNEGRLAGEGSPAPSRSQPRSTRDRVQDFSVHPDGSAAGHTAQSDDSGATRRWQRLRRLLVPVDFTMAALRALGYAEALAERFGSTICLLHVVETHPLALSE